MNSINEGFTLVELLVTMAILGILVATAFPAYRAWQQRAYGSEATVMLKQLINAEIAYYLEHEAFYPPGGGRISIWHDSVDPPNAVELVRQKLNILIPQKHLINYDLYSDSEDGLFYLIMTLYGNFNIFKGTAQIYAELDKDGKVEIMYGGIPE